MIYEDTLANNIVYVYDENDYINVTALCTKHSTIYNRWEEIMGDYIAFVSIKTGIPVNKLSMILSYDNDCLGELKHAGVYVHYVIAHAVVTWCDYEYAYSLTSFRTNTIIKNHEHKNKRERILFLVQYEKDGCICNPNKYHIFIDNEPLWKLTCGNTAKIVLRTTFVHDDSNDSIMNKMGCLLGGCASVRERYYRYVHSAHSEGVSGYKIVLGNIEIDCFIGMLGTLLDC